MLRLNDGSADVCPNCADRSDLCRHAATQPRGHHRLITARPVCDPSGQGGLQLLLAKVPEAGFACVFRRADRDIVDTLILGAIHVDIALRHGFARAPIEKPLFELVVGDLPVAPKVDRGRPCLGRSSALSARTKPVIR